LSKEGEPNAVNKRVAIKSVKTILNDFIFLFLLLIQEERRGVTIF